MQNLASLFVTLVIAANAFAPAAGLPDKLGVNVYAKTAVLGDESESESEDPSDDLQEKIKEAEEKRQEAADQLQERRQEALDNSLQEREQFQERLQEIQDQNKARVLKNLDQRLTSVISKWVNHWNNVLTRLTKILVKLQERADKAAAEGLDTSGVDAAIDDAYQTIADAQNALNDFASKDYTFDISDENNLGQDTKSFLTKFKDDMAETRDLVKQSREEVHAAFQELRSVVSQNEGEQE